MIDFRELMEELEFLQERTQRNCRHLTEADRLRLEELEDFNNEVDFSHHERYGTSFISEYDWEDYARDMAYNTIEGNLDHWPLNCIDWEQAAKELAYDYSRTEWEGVTYYYDG